MKPIIYKNGEVMEAFPQPNKTTFPPSETKPEQSLTIRQIYDRWTRGLPTSIHPLDQVYDEENDDSWVESNPIDIAEADNYIKDGVDGYNSEVERVKQAKKVRETAKQGESIDTSNQS